MPINEKEAGARAALQGVRVLDVSRILAAPYAAQILGDLGADVIKVERPGGGDDGRRFGIHALPDSDGGRSLNSSFHLAANRNKRSLAMEIATDEGREILLSLIDNSDVLIENFKVGTMARFGLDYDAVHARNPRLIYCSITGYGQEGPYAPRPGYDAVFQAQSGLMNVSGPSADAPDTQPYKTGPSIADIVAGMNAVIAILAALRHRDATGRGQYLDIALLDSTIALTSHSAMEYLISGVTVPRVGNQGNGGAPSGSFLCKDGRIYVSPGTEDQYHALCRVIGREDLMGPPEYASSHLRFINRAVLNKEIERSFIEWTVADLEAALSAGGVPVGVINDYAKVFADPQVRHRGIEIRMPHSVAGEISVISSPLRMSETPPTYRLPPPGVGEHGDEILRDLAGLSPEQIAKLRARRVI